MTYANIMLHMEIGRDSSGLLEIAGSLASRFHSKLTGIVACPPAEFQYAYGDGYLPSNILDEQRKELENGVQALEVQFRAALKPHADDLRWRSAITYAPIAEYLACEARMADLFITEVDRERHVFEAHNKIVSELVLQIGRPVLIVPEKVHSLRLDRVMLAWRDTRESRLAASLALPILKAARQVFVVSLVPQKDLAEATASLKDLRSWLEMHSIASEVGVFAPQGDDATELSAIADKNEIDLIVAGAYGHSRLREAMLGGVTHDLVLRPRRCTLVAH